VTRLIDEEVLNKVESYGILPAGLINTCKLVTCED